MRGEPDADFAQRMYVYNYRLFDRYGVPVVSLAVLGDDNPNWRPRGYHHGLWGCEVRLSFPVVKLADYTPRWEVLEADHNPFAVVVMTYLRTRATRGDPQGRLDTKLALVRHLYRRGFGREDILELFRFLDWLLALPEELAQRFRVELEAFEASMSTPYITSIERMGIQKGLQQGLQQGRHTSLLTILQVRFGDVPAEPCRRIEAIEDLSELERLLREAVTAESLHAFRSTLPPPAPE